MKGKHKAIRKISHMVISNIPAPNKNHRKSIDKLSSRIIQTEISNEETDAR